MLQTGKGAKNGTGTAAWKTARDNCRVVSTFNAQSSKALAKEDEARGAWVAGLGETLSTST